VARLRIIIGRVLITWNQFGVLRGAAKIELELVFSAAR
jgi:hypothetical protein